MTSKVYLETSFISYLTAKLSQDLTVLQRQLSSLRWWKEQNERSLIFSSRRASTMKSSMEIRGRRGTDSVATVYGCEYLLTWNFKHINNAQIKREATRIIERYGYQAPTICTPEELMGLDGAQG